MQPVRSRRTRGDQERKGRDTCERARGDAGSAVSAHRDEVSDEEERRQLQCGGDAGHDATRNARERPTQISDDEESDEYVDLTKAEVPANRVRTGDQDQHHQQCRGVRRYVAGRIAPHRQPHEPAQPEN